MKPYRLHLQPLEDRTTPATFGIPWLHNDITISFVPDGTYIGFEKSNLNAALGAAGITATALQAEVLRASQTWAARTNLNVGLVADDGSPFGTIGKIQRDARFGDVRVSGRPLDPSLLAITIPPGDTAETRVGDIILNTSYEFSIGGSGDRPDVCTVLLQEFGHALGVGNSTDPASVMYEMYGGKRTGLAASDIAAVRSLYGGPRTVDALEGSGNGTTTTAVALPSFAGTSTRYARADITASSDVDVYSFTTPWQLPNAVKVELTTAGVSQLAGKLELLDRNGNAIATASTNKPGVDLLVEKALSPNTKYYVRVTAPSGTGYRVGEYELRVITDSTAADPGAASAPVVVKDTGTNETRATATVLSALPGTTARAYYEVSASVDSTSDKDVYRVTAPSGGSSVLSVSLEALSFGLPANVQVTDALGNIVPTEQVTEDGWRRVYQATGVVGGASYYLTVTRPSFWSATDYKLTATYRSTAATFAAATTIDLTATNRTDLRTITLARTQVLTLNVGLESLGASPPPSVTVDVIDRASGRVVASVTLSPGTTTADAVLLAPGEYCIRTRANVWSTSTFTPVRVTLRLDALTDPIGMDAPSDGCSTPADGTGTLPTTLPDFDLVKNDADYYAWL